MQFSRIQTEPYFRLGRATVVACALVCLGINAQGADAPVDGYLAGLFTEHMVMQRDQRLPVWGRTTPGATVSVTLAGNQAKAVAGVDGKWQAWLPALPAGGPHILQVDGPERRTLNDVLIGDVWLCSGQSNMEWPVIASSDGKAEVAAAANPQLRHFLVGKDIAVEPEDDCTGTWSRAEPAHVGNWTAVGYYFGRDLQAHLKIPVGLINASWGGTRVEAWTSREALAATAHAAPDLAQLDALSREFPDLKKHKAQSRDAWLAGNASLIAAERDLAHQAKWSAPELDDSAWKEIQTPATWDGQGFSGMRGEAWYRKTVDIPAAWVGKDLEFSPGAADEVESSYFHGVKVGTTGSIEPFDVADWNKQRRYTVPGSLVKAGPTVLAVRVANLVGEGGLRSNQDPSFMYLRPVDAKEGLSLAGRWRFHMPISFREPHIGNPNVASVLHQAMIRPLMPFPIAGVIWYQGESNSPNAFAYRERFPAMITDWRTRWGLGDLPFLWVQLAAFQTPQVQPQADSWAVLRESQDQALRLPRTSWASALDVVDAHDIHPKDKRTVGQRLAVAARAVAYGEKIPAAGPRFSGMEVEGNRIRVTFDQAVVTKDGAPRRFAVAGVDRIFVWAEARIDGDSIVAWSERVPQPIAVRYAFETNPAGANVYNQAGLPASPFRSDDWPVPTQPEAAPGVVPGGF